MVTYFFHLKNKGGGGGHSDTIQLFDIQLMLVQDEGGIKGERERENRGKGETSSHLDGFQQAQTVTRVIRRNIPPVDRMIYSELLPKPEPLKERKKERKTFASKIS